MSTGVRLVTRYAAPKADKVNERQTSDHAPVMEAVVDQVSLELWRSETM